MGQQNSHMKQEFKPTYLKSNELYHYDKHKSQHTKKLCQIYKYISLPQLPHEKQIFNFRLFNKQLIVSPEGLEINMQQNFICGQQKCRITYYFYQTQICLFDILQISTSQGLKLLTQCIQGFRILLKVFDYFIPQAEMIVSQNGKWKVWISPDLTQIKNQHKIQNNLNNQLTFAKKLIRLFDILRDPQNPNFSYSSFIFGNQKYSKISSFQDIIKILTNSNPQSQKQKDLKKQKNFLKKYQRKRSLSFLSSKSSNDSQIKKIISQNVSTPFRSIEQKLKNNELQKTKSSFGNFKNTIRKQKSQYFIGCGPQFKRQSTQIFQFMNQKKKIDKQTIYQPTKTIQKGGILIKDKITQRSQKVPQSQVQISLPKQSQPKLKPLQTQEQVKNLIYSPETDQVKNQSLILSIKRNSKLSQNDKEGNKMKMHKRSLTDKTEQSKNKNQKKKVKICCSEEIFSDVLINKTNQNFRTSPFYDQNNKKENQFSDVLETYKQLQTNQKQTQFAIKIKTTQNFRQTLNNKGKTVKSIKILDTDVNIDDQIMKDLNFIINNGFIRRANKTVSINATITQMQSSST